MPRPIGNKDWSNEKTLHFLDLLAAESVIWDPNHKQHKNQQKIAESWFKLAEAMNQSVEDLKQKKKSLMASFRPLVNRKKKSLRTMLTEDDVYQPTWFAYEAMENFLGPLYFGDEYDVVEAANSANNSQDDSDSNSKHFSSQQNTYKVAVENVKSEPYSDTTSKELNELNDSISNLNDSLKRHKSEDEEDECDWYARLLAKKLRRLPENERAITMYEIDGMVVNRLCNLTHSSSCQNSPQKASQNIAMSTANSADRKGCICKEAQEQQSEDKSEQVEQHQEHVVEVNVEEHSDY